MQILFVAGNFVCSMLSKFPVNLQKYDVKNFWELFHGKGSEATKKRKGRDQIFIN